MRTWTAYTVRVHSVRTSCEARVGDCDDADFAFASSDASTCLDQMESAACNDAAEPWLDAPACKVDLCARARGAFVVSWSISNYYACEDTNIGKVGLVVRGADGVEQTTQWPCADGQGVPPTLDVVDAAVRFEVYDRSGRAMWSTETVEIPVDGAVTDLDEVVIPLGN